MDGGPQGCRNTPNCPCMSPSRAEPPNNGRWQGPFHLQGETKPTLALPAPLLGFATAPEGSWFLNTSSRNWESPGQVNRQGLELLKPPQS